MISKALSSALIALATSTIACAVSDDHAICAANDTVVDGQDWTKATLPAKSLTADFSCTLASSGVSYLGACLKNTWHVTFTDGTSQDYASDPNNGITMDPNYPLNPANPSSGFVRLTAETQAGADGLPSGYKSVLEIYIPQKAYDPNTLSALDVGMSRSSDASAAFISLRNLAPGKDSNGAPAQYVLGEVTAGQVILQSAGMNRGDAVSYAINDVELTPITGTTYPDQLLCPDGAYHIINN